MNDPLITATLHAACRPDHDAHRPGIGGVYVALGANLGPRRETLLAAIERIDQLPCVRALRCSSLHETRAVGGPANQPDYLNAAVEIDCQLEPAELLAALHEIERSFGRRRSVPNAPRTLDLDLLLFRELRSDDPACTLPHPRMWQRAFVLAPLAEIADVDALRRRWMPDDSSGGTLR